jgi:hypothetical protein
MTTNLNCRIILGINPEISGIYKKKKEKLILFIEKINDKRNNSYFLNGKVK